MAERRVLVLAGTAEATALARRLASVGVEVVASYAGVTGRRPELGCRVRVGGFGGVEGLAAWLREEGIGAVVDATHPYADRMPHHAATACARVGIARVRLLRPPWPREPGDRWDEAADVAEVRRVLAQRCARRVLIALGRQGLASLGVLGVEHEVVRTFTRPPDDPRPWEPLAPPLDLDTEVALMRRHRIDAVVTRNSGGSATSAKLAAARLVDARLVVLARPDTPPGPVATSVDAAVQWLEHADVG